MYSRLDCLGHETLLIKEVSPISSATLNSEKPYFYCLEHYNNGSSLLNNNPTRALSADGLDGNRLQVPTVNFEETAKKLIPRINHFIISSQCTTSDFKLKKRFFVKYLSCFGQHTANSP